MHTAMGTFHDNVQFFFILKAVLVGDQVRMGRQAGQQPHLLSKSGNILGGLLAKICVIIEAKRALVNTLDRILNSRFPVSLNSTKHDIAGRCLVPQVKKSRTWSSVLE